MQAERTGQTLPVENLFFDVNAKLEEQKKSGRRITLGFSLLISTKPNVVRYSSAGSVLMKGKRLKSKRSLKLTQKPEFPNTLHGLPACFQQHLHFEFRFKHAVSTTRPFASNGGENPDCSYSCGRFWGTWVSGEPSAAAPEVAGTGEKLHLLNPNTLIREPTLFTCGVKFMAVLD